MLDYFFFMFCYLSVFNLKVKGLNGFFYDYMDLDNTNSIRGICVWMIIFCHKTRYGIKKNYLYINITKNFGQKVVSMFLFYSGYGILESIKKKGITYIKSLPKKGAILFLKTQMILLIFLITFIFLFNIKITLKHYFLCLIFKSSLESSNWFSFTIIVLYFYSYLSFRSFKKPNFFSIIIISFICSLHVIFVYNYYYPKKIYAVDTVFCFVIGFYFSFFKEYFDKVLLNSDIYYFGIISTTILIYYKVFDNNNLIYISITNILFSLLIVFITIKVKFSNSALNFLNSHSYSIYLLHRLVMSVCYRKQIFKNSEFIQISFEFTSIFLISSLFDKYTLWIDKLFKKKYNEIESIKYIPLNYINYNSLNYTNMK